MKKTLSRTEILRELVKANNFLANNKIIPAERIIIKIIENI